MTDTAVGLAGAIGAVVFVAYGVRLMRCTTTEKIAFLEGLQGAWCVLVVAKGVGRGQLLFEERGVLGAVDSGRVAIEREGKSRSFALGELRGVKRPNGEVLVNWDGGRAFLGMPELQAFNEGPSIRRAKLGTCVILASTCAVFSRVLWPTPLGPILLGLAIVYSSMSLLILLTRARKT